MPQYRVKWEIDIEAGTPEQAAKQAPIIQRDSNPANTATCFDVREFKKTAWTQVDLLLDKIEEAAG